MICAHCGEELVADPVGWVHQSGSMYGVDGHTVTAISRVAFYLGRAREEYREALDRLAGM